MEEKEVAMSGQETQNENVNNEGTKKVSYDELVNIANQLNQQCQALARQKQELIERLEQLNGVEARLHYLFKILENRFAFDDEYVVDVADEIKEIMTIKDEPAQMESEGRKE